MKWAGLMVLAGLLVQPCYAQEAILEEVVEQEQAVSSSSATTEETRMTVITSDRLDFNYEKKYAKFENNVVVTDPDMKLTADRLVVRFSEDGQAEAIEAKGNVRITQMDKIAEADVATYTVEDGRIALEGNPKVHRGKDRLEGDTIVFWRDQNKMICEPHARLVIFPEKGGARDQLFGE